MSEHREEFASNPGTSLDGALWPGSIQYCMKAFSLVTVGLLTPLVWNPGLNVLQ